MSGFSPTPADQAKIASWIPHLRSRLSPAAADRKQTAAALAKMVTGFSIQDRGLASDVTADVYMIAVAEQPAWAVIEACRRFICGDISTGGFAPTPPQLRQAVDMVLRPVKAELDDLEAIQAAGDVFEPTLTERGFIKQGFEDLKAELRKDQEPRWYDNPEVALRKRAEANGIDYDTAMAGIQDAEARP